MRPFQERQANETGTDFNPRTREGCDEMRIDDITWTLAISIHAPVKGATFYLLMRAENITNFNPRTREGCDYPQFTGTMICITISIHAPVKGATR